MGKQIQFLDEEFLYSFSLGETDGIETLFSFLFFPVLAIAYYLITLMTY